MVICIHYTKILNYVRNFGFFISSFSSKIHQGAKKANTPSVKESFIHLLHLVDPSPRIKIILLN